MHFVTLATVEIPHIEEDEELNAKIAEKAENLKEQAKGTIMMRMEIGTDICATLMVNGIGIRLVDAGQMCYW